MNKIYFIKKKRYLKGNRVSHSNKKTIRKFFLNLKKKKIFIKNSNFIRIKICTKFIKKLDKIYNNINLKYFKNVKKKSC